MHDRDEPDQACQERVLPVAALTSAAFSPFGTVIASADEALDFDAARDGLVLDRGVPRFYIMRLRRRGLVFHQITRHRRVTQCLAAVGGKPWLIAVAPPGNVRDDAAEPALEDIRAFRIPGDVAIRLHLGTWHAGPYFEDPEISFFNLELADTNDVDHHSCRLDLRYAARLRFDA